MNEWIVSRTMSKDLGWHVQVRTADQLCSFALLTTSKNKTFLRTKAADGKTDVFTVMSDTGHATMNVVGKIKYTGDWKDVV